MWHVLAVGAFSILVLDLVAPAAFAGDELVDRRALVTDAQTLSGELQGYSLLTGATSDSHTDTTLTLDVPTERNPPGPDWVGLGRDTLFLLGYHVATIGVLYGLPESVSNWTDEEKKHLGSKWLDNVQHPTFDDDNWAVNYVGHPYFGAAYYIRARERGFGEFPSFLYSAFASTLYEFGVEALFENPSIQDLIVTPVGGALVGRFLFEPLRTHIKAKPELRWYDQAGLVLTDPIGALNGLFERWLGIKSHVRVSVRPPQSSTRESRVSVKLELPW